MLAGGIGYTAAGGGVLISSGGPTAAVGEPIMVYGEAVIVSSAAHATSNSLQLAAAKSGGSSSSSNKNESDQKTLDSDQKKKIEKLRNGGEVEVKTYEEARELLDNMPELKPATEEGRLPNPDGRMRDGFADPNGTYRGDLINKQDPMGPVHPGVQNPNHANYPHYNIKLPNGNKASIIIKGE